MFGLFKKNKNILKDLEKVENEFQGMDVHELMHIMMRISKIEYIDLSELKKHTFILLVLTLNKMGYKINENDLDIEKNRDFTIAINDCAWRIRDNIIDRLTW